MFRDVDLRHEAALLQHEDRLKAAMARNEVCRALAESAEFNRTQRPAPERHRARFRPAFALHHHHRRMAVLHR